MSSTPDLDEILLREILAASAGEQSSGVFLPLRETEAFLRLSRFYWHHLGQYHAKSIPQNEDERQNWAKQLQLEAIPFFLKSGDYPKAADLVVEALDYTPDEKIQRFYEELIKLKIGSRDIRENQRIIGHYIRTQITCNYLSGNIYCLRPVSVNSISIERDSEPYIFRVETHCGESDDEAITDFNIHSGRIFEITPISVPGERPSEDVRGSFAKSPLSTEPYRTK